MLNEIARVYEYREMLKNTVKKELRARYKGSALGFFWTFLNPLLTLGVYSIVFSLIIKIVVHNCNYTIFLFTGLVPWMFFSATLLQSTTVVISNAGLVKKVYFPRAILPMSITFTNLINMLLTMIIIIAVLLAAGIPATVQWLYLPPIIFIETVFALAFSLLLSSLTVYLRDIEHIISVVSMAWFYLTPVVYTTDYIPARIYGIAKLNPMLSIINSYRDVLLFGRMPDLAGLSYAFLISMALAAAGYCIFQALQKRFAEEL